MPDTLQSIFTVFWTVSTSKLILSAYRIVGTENEVIIMKVKTLMQKLEAQKARSKWQKGVKTLAFMLIEGYMCNSTGDYTEENTDIYNAFEWLDYPVDDDLYKRFRNRDDAKFYACQRSVEGCQFLCATDDICQLLCTDSELKKTPQKCRDNCIEYETRAVYQACLLINRIIADNK